MPILKYLGTDDFKYIEVRNGVEKTIKNGDIVNAEEDSKLNEYPSLFEEVFYTNDIRHVKKSITSAQILAGNTTPIEIIASPGVGKAIQVIGAVGTLYYNTTAYDTNVTLGLSYTSTPTTLLGSTNLLLDSEGGVSVFALTSGFCEEDTGVSVVVDTGDPTDGDSDITISVLYRIIDIDEVTYPES